PETIPDFEKVCLESDLQLAEVAACHQILALVLNEPVEFAPPLRDRIYRVGQVSVSPMPTSQTVQKTEHQNQPPELPSIEKAPQTVETTAPPVGEQKKLTEEKVTRAKPEVPDYLKAGQKRLVPLVITALAVFIVLSVVFFAIGPKQIASWFGGDEPSESPDASAKLTPKPGTPEADSTSTDGSPADGVKLGETDSLKDSGPTPPNGKTPVVEPNPAVPTRDGSLTDGVKEPDDDSPKVAPVPLPIPGVDLPKRTPGDVPPKTIDKPEDNPAVKPTVVPDQPDPRPVVAVDMGRFTSENQVIARYDSEAGASYRLVTNSRLRSKDRLIVPPTYRPQLAFSSGLQTTLVGPLQLQLDAIAEEATPHLKVDYGRALLMTIRAGAKVSLNLGGKKGLATFSTADSSMAIDVQHYRAPGTDPETGVSHLIVHLIALRGEIVWQHADGELTIGPNGVVMHFDDQVARTGKLKKLPTWIVAPKLGSGDSSSAEANMQEYGSPIVTRLIDERRPLVVSLEETLNHKNVEVRALAAHGLNQLGNHDSFLTLLADKMNKPYWDYHFDAAQQALARDPQAAAERDPNRGGRRLAAGCQR
ncbi:MAG: hypothetical protein IH991_15880, partial [Planctomycetes bacterium]|nr:hypothetical protein [Planctomycetota bacterium]